jgi:aminoglycoside phosphotransferase (APT) family kinase protein
MRGPMPPNDSEERELARLTAWFAAQLPDADDVHIRGSDRSGFGHSAEMLLMTLVSRAGSDETAQEVVVKLRPPSPGLLEPYDLPRQFRILRALEPTDVRAPRALWLEPTGDVLGREFYVMERALGEAYERVVPAELDADPRRIPRMCESLLDQLAAIHLVDLRATALDGLADGASFIERQLEHWSSKMRAVQRGALPALERLLAELVRQRPVPSARTTLVHGDAKPGNFGFVGDEVSAVFDWEMTDVGDPLADIGYLELMWSYPVGITSRPTAPAFGDLLPRYEQLTGITIENRAWYLAFQAYKTAVILLLGSMLFEAGHSDDMRYVGMGLGVDMTTQTGLHALGVDDELDAGAVLPSTARIEAVQARVANEAN